MRSSPESTVEEHEADAAITRTPPAESAAPSLLRRLHLSRRSGGSTEAPPAAPRPRSSRSRPRPTSFLRLRRPGKRQEPAPVTLDCEPESSRVPVLVLAAAASVDVEEPECRRQKGSVTKRVLRRITGLMGRRTGQTQARATGLGQREQTCRLAKEAEACESHLQDVIAAAPSGCISHVTSDPTCSGPAPESPTAAPTPRADSREEHGTQDCIEPPTVSQDAWFDTGPCASDVDTGEEITVPASDPPCQPMLARAMPKIVVTAAADDDVDGAGTSRPSKSSPIAKRGPRSSVGEAASQWANGLFHSSLAASAVPAGMSYATMAAPESGDVRTRLRASIASASTVSSPNAAQFTDGAPPPLVVRERIRRKGKKQGELVWLHIYDVGAELEWVNGLTRKVGTGAFHAAVEIFGEEWSYGYAPEGKTGVYKCKPRCNFQHKYRESVSMGRTSFSKAQMDQLVEELSREWPGADYELLARNCCHFSDSFCRRLGVGPVPQWVISLAGAGAALVDGVDQTLLAAGCAAGMAAAKAGELDDRFHISGSVEAFFAREVEVDEGYLSDFFSTALQNLAAGPVGSLAAKAAESFAPVGAYAERLFDDAMKPIEVEERIELLQPKTWSMWNKRPAPTRKADLPVDTSPTASSDKDAGPRALANVIVGRRLIRLEAPPRPPMLGDDDDEPSEISDDPKDTCDPTVVSSRASSDKGAAAVQPSHDANELSDTTTLGASSLELGGAGSGSEDELDAQDASTDTVLEVQDPAKPQRNVTSAEVAPAPATVSAEQIDGDLQRPDPTSQGDGIVPFAEAHIDDTCVQAEGREPAASASALAPSTNQVGINLSLEASAHDADAVESSGE